jgi:twitching motility protein PilT
MDITELLAFTIQQKASDLHLTGAMPPVFRVSGELKPLKSEPLSGDQVKAMIYAIMTDEQRALYEAEKELDFAISFGDSARFRVNAFNTNRGAAAVFRTIPVNILSLDQLKAPPLFRQLAGLERGLVLVTGPTGSGKSTTLAAMIDHINRSSARHVLTVEDPVEFVHRSDKALINHREVGPHTKSFARALKSALREDPDVILVGEMRDRETISLALTAAETGHLVMGTLHTSSAAKTIDRIVDVFPGEDKEMVRAMLAGSLQAVIAQLLLRTPSGGRVAAHEILVGTTAVRNLIRENKIPQIYSMMQVGAKFGMQTMQDAVTKLQQAGQIDPAEAARILASAESEGQAASSTAAQQPAAAPGQPAPPLAPAPPMSKNFSF